MGIRYAAVNDIWVPRACLGNNDQNLLPRAVSGIDQLIEMSCFNRTREREREREVAPYMSAAGQVFSWLWRSHRSESDGRNHLREGWNSTEVQSRYNLDKKQYKNDYVCWINDGCKPDAT